MSKYLFDPHNEMSENIVRNESHTISSLHGEKRVLIPTFAPFYREGLVVKHNGRELTQGVDYYLGNLYERCTHITAQPCYGSLYGFFELTGTITLETYHTVGGTYHATSQQLSTYLAGTVDPTNDNWEAVIGDKFIPPVNIKFDRDNWRGEQELIAAIDSVSKAISDLDPKDSTKYLYLNSRVAFIEQIIRESNWEQHKANKNNPHGVTKYDIHALGKNDRAQNALKAYSKTINELAAYINERGITQADLDRYMKLTGNNTMLGNISLVDGMGVISNVGSDQKVVIDPSSGSFKLVAEGSSYYEADKDRVGGRYARMKSGKNELKVRSDGRVQRMDGLLYNDHTVLHEGNIESSIPDTYQPEFNAHTRDTSTLRFEGNGKEASKLKAHIKYPEASEFEHGVSQLSDRLDENNPKKSAVPNVEKRLKEQLSQRADNTITVNDQRFDGNIQLTKADKHIGLDKVDNTRVADKPLSYAQQDAFEGLSPKVHHHKYYDTGMPPASKTVKGIAKSRTVIEEDDRSNGISPSVIENDMESVIYAESEVRSKLPNTVIDVKYYYCPMPPSKDPALNTIEFATDAQYYCSRVMYKIKPFVLNASHIYASHDIAYVYVTCINGVGEYVAYDSIVPDDVYQTHIASIRKNGEVLYFNQKVTRLGSFREFDEHLTDRYAHGLNNITKKLYKLDLVPNKGIKHEFDVVSFQDVFNTWKRISHAGSNPPRYPHDAAEANRWEYRPELESIVCTVNSATLIGFVSPEGVGDHKFETEIYVDTVEAGNDRDNDSIVIILAYTEKNGRQYTLCAVRSGSTEGHLKVHSRFEIIYNYQQFDQQSIAYAHVAGDASDGVWYNSGGHARILSERVGNVFTVKTTPIKVPPMGDFASTLTVDLNSNPVLEVFKGACQFGYGAYSQTASAFKMLSRPDADNSTYLASAAVTKQLYEHRTGIKIITGVVSSNQTLSPPAGYTKNQCHVLLYPRDINSSIGYRRTHKIKFKIDSNLHVSATNENTSVGIESLTCNYLMIAKKYL